VNLPALKIQALKKSRPLLAFACLFSLLGTFAAKAEDEVLQFELPTDWKIAARSMQHRILTVAYTHHGENIHGWTEQFTYQNGGLSLGAHSPTEYLDNLKALREKECAGVTEWHVIEQKEDSLLYEWQAKPCLAWPDQHEIARILYGKHNVFILRYASKGTDLAPEIRTKWIKTFADAYIQTGAHGVNTAAGNVDAALPVDMNKVIPALKAAMASVNCNVTDEKPGQIECKRPRHPGSDTDYGGESVTAKLETQTDKTHILITTGKGYLGRLAKKNWSTYIYEQMLKNLDQPPPPSTP